MCGSSLDACTPALLCRDADYRGNNPLYRAGSIFYGHSHHASQVVLADRAHNAGNYGQTTPTTQNQKPEDSSSFAPWMLDTNTDPLDVPSIEELKNNTRYIGIPTDIPTDSPREIPTVPDAVMPPRDTAPPSEENSIETIPFVNTSTGPLTKPNSYPIFEEPQFTVEDLRRLESSDVTEIKILHVEDDVDNTYGEEFWSTPQAQRDLSPGLHPY